MGLDMYLERKKRNVEADAENAWEEVMYWRKANQIREWFANNLLNGVENCKRSAVFLDDLEELLEACETVLADHSKADELLPTSSGFFFGSTEYDEWYFEDLKETVEGIKRVIEETDWEAEDVAYFEWWQIKETFEGVITMLKDKYQNYEIVTKRKLYDYCDLPESEEEKFREELWKEQTDFLTREITTKNVIIHFIEDTHFCDNHYEYAATENVDEHIQYLAIKDGIDLVRFSNGNLGFVAYYNGHKNGFEIIPTEMTEEEFEEVSMKKCENYTDRYGRFIN